jgi:hypothetical protein
MVLCPESPELRSTFHYTKFHAMHQTAIATGQKIAALYWLDPFPASWFFVFHSSFGATWAFSSESQPNLDLLCTWWTLRDMCPFGILAPATASSTD